MGKELLGYDAIIIAEGPSAAPIMPMAYVSICFPIICILNNFVITGDKANIIAKAPLIIATSFVVFTVLNYFILLYVKHLRYHSIKKSVSEESMNLSYTITFAV